MAYRSEAAAFENLLRKTRTIKKLKNKKFRLKKGLEIFKIKKENSGVSKCTVEIAKQVRKMTFLEASPIKKNCISFF